MIVLPTDARLTIARTAADVVVFAEARAPDRPGPRKFAIARAEGMRRLKASGMPRELAGRMRPFLEDPDDEVEDLDELSDGERALLDAGADAAGATVDVVADAVERDTGCKCNRQILALVKALLESGIEAAVQAAL